MIGTHRLGEKPWEDGARGRVDVHVAYKGTLSIRIMVRDHDGRVLWNYEGRMRMMRERVERDAALAWDCT